MLLLLLCFALAYAIQGAASQAWSDGRAGAKTAGTRAREVYGTKAAQVRENGSRPARFALGFATVFGGVVRGLYGVGKGSGKAVWTGGKAGWKHGWETGKQRAQARQDKSRERREARPAQTPTWRNFVTGQCPTCGHTPKEASEPIDDCRCDALDWGCACARRAHRLRSVPDLPDDPDRPKVDLRKPDRPVPVAVPEPRPPSDSPTPVFTPAPTPEPTPTEDPVTAPTATPTSGNKGTGEAQSIVSTRHDLAAVEAAATTHLDTAAVATAEAAELRAMAERMRANLSMRHLDAAVLGEISRLIEQANRLDEAARALASAADGTSAAARTALAKVNEWSHAEEAIKARPRGADGQAIDSEWLAAG